MKKELTTREKVLLVVLACLLVLLAWFKLVYEPVTDQIKALTNQMTTERNIINAKKPQIEAMKRMEEETARLKAEKNAVAIPFFDNSKPLMVALNEVLSDAESYTMTFGEGTKDDYIITHKIKLSFSAENYQTARTIIDRLTLDTYINQISDVSVSMINKLEDSETTKVDLLITFFEVEP